MAPWRRLRPARVGVASTLLPGLKPSVMDKTRRILEERLKPAGAASRREVRVPHESGAARRRASPALRRRTPSSSSSSAPRPSPTGATSSRRRSRLPAGKVQHFGMPVDPGNLLLLGELDGRPVLGAPGCARSPKENGFDWVLQPAARRTCRCTRDDITGMGVGGLLMEIVSRPQPREPAAERGAPARSRPSSSPPASRAAWAARTSSSRASTASRSSGASSSTRCSKSRASSVIVVTGHEAELVAAALAGLDVRIVHNPDYAEGLATSLRRGLAAVPDERGRRGGLPRRHAGRHERGDRSADRCVPTASEGRPHRAADRRTESAAIRCSGRARSSPSCRTSTGDIGARHILGENEEAVVESRSERPRRSIVDTPEALAAAGGVLAKAASPWTA